MNLLIIADISEGHYYQEQVINDMIDELRKQGENQEQKQGVNQERKQGENDVKLSLVVFNERIQYKFLNKPLETVEKVSLNIEGKSGLLDKISAILIKLMHFYETVNVKDVNVYILTNGVDTCSKYITPPMLSLQIQRNRLRGWKFVYFGKGYKSDEDNSENGNENKNEFL